MVPILVTGFQCLFDQQAAETGAVDEQVAFNALARFERDGRNEAAFGILVDRGDLALDALDTEGFTKPAQVRAVQRRVEVVGVRQGTVLSGLELARLGRQHFQTIVRKLATEAHRLGMQPEVMERRHPWRFADRAEGMEIVVTQPRPVVERNAKLDARLAAAHEVALVDAQVAVEGANGRYRGFAHADDADLGRLDQGDIEQRPQQLAQCGGDAPSRRAAAGDDDLFNDLSVHDDLP